MKKIVNILILLLIGVGAYSQSTVTGTFSAISNQMIKLVGFEGFNTYTIDSVMASDEGVYNLSFTKKDYGMGYLVAADNKPFNVILSSENIKLKGEAFALTETIEIKKGKQNQIFAQYASDHPRREQALSAWNYLAKIYKQDSLFGKHELPQQAIGKEKQRIKAEDRLFLASLDQATFVSWFLPVRKLISSVSTIAQYHAEEIPTAINAFRKIDYTDNRLYKSGLLSDVIESHFWLIENSGRSLDSMYIEMNISIDYLIENLIADEKKLNEITNILFKSLEKRSLFKASEHLALKVLNEASCTINSDLASQLESYRAMKMGNTAPDFEFNGDIFTPGYESDNIPKKLSDLKSNYTIVIFGSSWCPQCPKELSQISGLYQKWKKHNVEVVFVSLDEDNQLFKTFAGVFPFISSCNYQKWESPVVKDYHVFATPTIYLLDNKREILLRPISVIQLDSWIDWYLVQGNK
jgi:thiol-disulfide isomerase/thioredoxin